MSKVKHSDDVWRRGNANNATEYKKAYKDKDDLSKADRRRVDEYKEKLTYKHKTEEDIFS